MNHDPLTTDKLGSKLKKVLLISRVPQNNATTIEDHVNAIVELSAFEIQNMDVNDPCLALEIARTDCILLHYSVIAYPFRQDRILSSALRLQISRAGKPVLHMVQDEQRNVLERFRYFEALGVTHVFSVADEEVYNLMYPVSLRNFTVSTILTGYLPMNLERYREVEWSSRTIDISYRARRLPEWYGNLGFTKSNISDNLNAIKKNEGLVINASCEENDRLYGQDWIDFLCNSKVAVGTESGSSTLDMDGRYLEDWQNRSSIGSHAEVEPISANYAAISPRIFEYVAAKCLLALTPGEYSRVITPGLHYFELQPDLSNLEDLINLMNNKEDRNRMIERAYKDLIMSGNYGYKHMVREIDIQIKSSCKATEILEFSRKLNIDIKSTSNQDEQMIKTSRVFTFLTEIMRLTVSIKSKTYQWSLSRRGVTRIILRNAYRILQRILTSKIMKFLTLLLTSNFQIRREHKRVFSITRRIFLSARLIPELELIRSEAELISNQGATLKFLENNSSLWLSWPESIQQGSKLKEHPKLDSVHFSDAQGVWITRSDFSEVNKPLKLMVLSKYLKRNRLKTVNLIEIYCGPLAK